MLSTASLRVHHRHRDLVLGASQISSPRARPFGRSWSALTVENTRLPLGLALCLLFDAFCSILPKVPLAPAPNLVPFYQTRVEDDSLDRRLCIREVYGESQVYALDFRAI